MFDPAACVDDDVATAVLEGTLSAEERALVDLHLDGCASCRRLLSRLASIETTHAPESSLDALELARGTVVGRFVALDRVGRGGMGVVYAAYDPDLDRKVALKLIATDSEDAADASLRLVREAQSMARVSHPNVVAVHDVGRVGARVFITMEFVEGGTLRAWLAAEPRSVREILRVFIETGRGLAAAHAAGVVHRDFKPDNVLIAKDGRARVTDFGLARGPGGVALESGERRALPPEAARADGARTQHGAIMGTPAYMSPEQHRGERADERSDQYAFCVALYQALFGRLPFCDTSNPSFEALRDATLSGQVLRFPSVARINGAVRNALRTGLELEPTRRFPSMNALLHALDRGLSSRRTRSTIGLSALALAGIGSALLYRAHVAEGTRCANDPSRLAGVWDDARKASIARRFHALRSPLADDAYARVLSKLDAWTHAWTDARQSACMAVRVHHREPEEMLALRTACLDRRLGELAAASDLFASADLTVVEHAVEMAYGVAPVADCLDTALLTSQPLPPRDASVRVKSDALQRELDRATELRYAGKYAAGSEVAERALEAARALDHPPILAEALYLAGWLREDNCELIGAEERIYKAAAVADAAHDDRVRARAWTRLIRVVGYREARHDQGEMIAEVAEAALRRAGAPPELAAELESNEQALLRARGKYPEARTHAARALALAERAFGQTDPRVATALDALGQVFEETGAYAEATPLEERALQIRQRVFGVTHPEVGRSYSNLAWDFFHAERFDDARAMAEKSIAIYEAVLGKSDPQLAVPLDVLGLALLGLGKNEEAQAALSRALALERAPHAEHPYVASILCHLASAELRLGHAELAFTEVEQAKAMQLRLLAPDHPSLAETLLASARILRALARPSEAVARAREAARVAEHAFGAESPRILASLDELALSEAASGNTAAAAIATTRAARLRRNKPPESLANTTAPR